MLGRHGYSPDSGKKTTNRLQSVPVEICTNHANGPRPVIYSPTAPVYKKPREATSLFPQQELSADERQQLIDEHFPGMFAVQW